MNQIKSNIFIIIATVVIGVLIGITITSDRSSKQGTLSAEQYQKAYNTRNELYKEISNLKENNNKIDEKIQEYNDNSGAQSKILDGLKQELRVNMRLSGILEARGQGIKIVMSDGGESFEGEILNNFLIMYRIIHDDDMINVVNELKEAGAEAISINNQRIVYNSEIYCAGQFFRLNGVKVPGPFYINVIGNFVLLLKTFRRY